MREISAPTLDSEQVAAYDVGLYRLGPIGRQPSLRQIEESLTTGKLRNPGDGFRSRVDQIWVVVND